MFAPVGWEIWFVLIELEFTSWPTVTLAADRVGAENDWEIVSEFTVAWLMVAVPILAVVALATPMVALLALSWVTVLVSTTEV